MRAPHEFIKKRKNEEKHYVYPLALARFGIRRASSGLRGNPDVRLEVDERVYLIGERRAGHEGPHRIQGRKKEFLRQKLRYSFGSTSKN